MNYSEPQKELAELTLELTKRFAKAEWFRENTPRQKSLTVHRTPKYKFVIENMYNHVEFYYMEPDESRYELFSYYSMSDDNITCWDGVHSGSISYQKDAQISLYDHYMCTRTFEEFGNDEYTKLNEMAENIARQMFPVYKEFTLTEEEHFQLSLIYDLMSYEDTKMWHDVLTCDVGIDKGIAFFSIHDLDLADDIRTALLNIDAISKETLND